MNISNMIINLNDLYEKSLIDNSPFYEEVVGDYRISVTHKQATILDLVNGRIVMALIDIGSHSSNNTSQLFCTNKNCSISITSVLSNDITIIGELIRYLVRPAMDNETTVDLYNLNNDILFQLSTVMNIPSEEKIEMLKTYFEYLNKFCYMYNRTLLIDLDMDWSTFFLELEINK